MMILQILILSLAICTSVDKHIGPFPNIIGGKFHDLARPYLADINVDCHIKRAAYDFAKEIQPERKNHRAVFDALQLQQCNMERPPQDEPLNIPDIEYPGFTVFVDGHSGNDKNSGTIRDPVKTIERGIALTRGVSGNRTLYLREGEYYLSKPLLLTKIDDDLTISSYNNEKVVLSGAKEVKVDWKPYRVGEFDIFQGKDAVVDIKPAPGAGVEGRVKFAGKVPSLEECQELCAKDEECTGFTWYEKEGDYFNQCFSIIDGEFRTVDSSSAISGVKLNIYVADLSEIDFDEEKFTSLFINGKRQILARYPNGNPEYTGYHTENTGFATDGDGQWKATRKFPPGYEIHMDKPSIEHSLYTNYQIAIDGPAVQWTPAISYWALAHPIGGGGCTYAIPTGIDVATRNWSPREWKHPNGAIFHAFQGGYWGFWMFEVDSYERKDGKISLGWTKGGFQECRGSTHGGAFFIENVLEELDAPGEYFYDKEAKKLYLYPNGTISDMSLIHLSQQENLIEIRGSSSLPVKNIHIHGLTFSYTRNTYMEQFEVPSGGDWALHRGGCIFVDGAENIHISYNIFRNNGNNNIFFANHVTYSMIEYNEFVYGSDSGILFIGSSNLMDGTQETHPHDNIIQHNLLHELGLYNKQSSPFMQSKTARTIWRDNIFFNVPRAGININDAFGGGNLIERSLMFNTVRETADHGPVNTWDRMPFITLYDSGEPSTKPKQSEIRQVFAIANYHAVWPLDHDDGSCYYYDYDNVLVYGGFKTYLGHSKISMNNLYIYPDTKYAGDVNEFFTEPHCANTAGSHDTYGWGEVYRNNSCIIKNPDVLWFNGVTESTMVELTPDLDFNHYYTPNGREKSYILTGSTRHSFDEFAEKYGKDVHSQFHDLPSGAEIEQWIRNKLHMK